MEHTPTFRVTVVSRSVQAVNYKHRGGATKMDFAGTDLMPQARGEAKVESKKGYIEIEVEFANLEKPTTFGNEYLTYILWAISPEGRAVNLGEILVGDNHRSKVDVTTDLAGLRSGRDRGTLLCGAAAQQRGGARKRGPRGYQGDHRGHAHQV